MSTVRLYLPSNNKRILARAEKRRWDEYVRRFYFWLGIEAEEISDG